MSNGTVPLICAALCWYMSNGTVPLTRAVLCWYMSNGTVPLTRAVLSGVPDWWTDATAHLALLWGTATLCWDTWRQHRVWRDGGQCRDPSLSYGSCSGAPRRPCAAAKSSRISGQINQTNNNHVTKPTTTTTASCLRLISVSRIALHSILWAKY